MRHSVFRIELSGKSGSNPFFAGLIIGFFALISLSGHVAAQAVQQEEAEAVVGTYDEDDLSRLRPEVPEDISAGELEDSIARGARSLLETQREDGAWGGPQWTGGVDQDPIGAFDSFDVAVTAMCLEALLDVEQSDEVIAANEKAFEFLMAETGDIRRADGGNLPHIWAHCYCIQTFSKIYSREEDEQERERLAEAIRLHMTGLDRWQSINGGWFYYGNGMAKPANPSCSFVNAAVLVALARARDQGIEVDQEMLQKALNATQLMRKPDSSFFYSAMIPGNLEGAMNPINRPAGSLGRSQAGNIALRLWNDADITDEVIMNWLNRLVTRHGWLDMGRKRRIPHVAPAAVAGYFYYFGMYYGTVCMEVLPDNEREFYQHHLARLIIDRQEPDGSWFDYPLYSYHKPYGTAFAMLSLQRCRVGR